MLNEIYEDGVTQGSKVAVEGRESSLTDGNQRLLLQLPRCFLSKRLALGTDSDSYGMAHGR